MAVYNPVRIFGCTEKHEAMLDEYLMYLMYASPAVAE
jgi:hypothetical protein